MEDPTVSVSTVRPTFVVDRLPEAISLLEAQLTSKGYAAETNRRYLRACRGFLRWLSQSSSTLTAISESVVDLFLSEHLPRCGCLPRCPHILSSRAGLRHLLCCYQSRFDDSLPASTAADDSLTAELSSYAAYLAEVCGVASETKLYRLRYVEEFLRDQFGNGKPDPDALTAQKLRSYVNRRARGCKPGTVGVIAGSIRSYLRFLQLRGDIEVTLFRAVPGVPKWSLSEYPMVLSTAEVATLLGSFDRSNPVGIRDYAIALCMVCMGMRASEVAGIHLEDLDWSPAILRIRRTKSRKPRLLPITQECGRSFVQYLKNGRPKTDCRHLFVRHTVPLGKPLNTEQVRGAMRRAYGRCGFPPTWTGTHLLRHTAAASMYCSGATLKELADILGHQSIDTTRIYTKVNVRELRTVSMPWPGGEI